MTGLPLTMAQLHQRMMQQMSSGRGMSRMGQMGGMESGMSTPSSMSRGQEMIPPRSHWLDPDTVLMLRRHLNLSNEQVGRLRTIAGAAGQHTRMVLTDAQFARLKSYAQRSSAQPGPTSAKRDRTDARMPQRKDPPASVRESRDEYPNYYSPGSTQERLIDEDGGFGGDEGFGGKEGFGGDEGFGDDEGFDEDEGLGDERYGFGEGFGNDEGFGREEGFGNEQGFGGDEGFRGEEGFRDGERLGGDEGFGPGFRGR